MNSYKLIGKSVLAGIFIGIASLLYNNLLISTNLIIIPAITFSIGLICVLYFKSFLFTGKIGFISKWKDIIYLTIMLFFNLLICIPLNIITINGMAAPVFLSQPFLSLFLKGIICGMFIYMAVYFWNKQFNKNKILTTTVCVSGFILCGSRHCIADFASLCLFTPVATFCGWIPLLKILVIALGNSVGSIFLHQMNLKKYLT